MRSSGKVRLDCTELQFQLILPIRRWFALEKSGRELRTGRNHKSWNCNDKIKIANVGWWRLNNEKGRALGASQLTWRATWQKANLRKEKLTAIGVSMCGKRACGMARSSDRERNVIFPFHFLLYIDFTIIVKMVATCTRLQVALFFHHRCSHFPWSLGFSFKLVHLFIIYFSIFGTLIKQSTICTRSFVQNTINVQLFLIACWLFITARNA